MPDQIICEKLSRDKLHLFRHFHCGEDRWARAVAEWITGRSPECAAKDIQDRRCKVYLYRNQAAQVIGFGAVGTTKGEWPNASDPKISVAIIPWLGLHSGFHGQPIGPDEIRYSDQILADLVYKAKATGRKYLVLFVDPENAAAIRLYERNGFERSEKPLLAGEHMGMSLNLESVSVG
jgi:ribosomal protein S18 acetylase RimI-like enzyme